MSEVYGYCPTCDQEGIPLNTGHFIEGSYVCRSCGTPLEYFSTEEKLRALGASEKVVACWLEHPQIPSVILQSEKPWFESEPIRKQLPRVARQRKLMPSVFGRTADTHEACRFAPPVTWDELGES